MSSTLFAEEERLRKIDKHKDPLLQLDQHIDFRAIATEVDHLCPRPSRSKGGRAPFPTELMVRILVIKSLWNLSDEQLEYQLLDRASFQRFTSLQNSARIPDAKTIWAFSERLSQAGAADVIFGDLNRQLYKAGYWSRGGQIVDATIVPTPIQRNTKEENTRIKQGDVPDDWQQNKRRQKDTDARWTKKHGKSYFGYKASVNVDKRCKLIRKIHVSDAGEGDQRHLAMILDPMNTNRDLYADRGYTMTEQIAEQDVRDCIQRRGQKAHPLNARQKQRNKHLAKTRARVEHVFGAMEQMGGKWVRCIGLKRADFAIKMKASVYNMRRLVCLKGGVLDPF
jgi:IS5 family transposase